MNSGVLFWACSHFQISTFTPFETNLHSCWKSKPCGIPSSFPKYFSCLRNERETGQENRRELSLCVSWASFVILSFNNSLSSVSPLCLLSSGGERYLTVSFNSNHDNKNCPLIYPHRSDIKNVFFFWVIFSKFTQ